MSVSEIYLLRHGHRLSWTLDPTTGKYTSTHPFPTRLPADPPLASHGVSQAQETGVYLSHLLSGAATEDRLRIYSSLFYRCLETLRPTVEKLRGSSNGKLLVRGERGVGEWFGKAWFRQPVPAAPGVLKEKFFDWVDAGYASLVVPEGNGERIEELHDRLARALAAVVGDVEREYKGMGRGEEKVCLLVCGHAAQIIAAGRVLTGEMPGDPDVEDFRCFTGGISKFVRRGRVARENGDGDGMAGEDEDEDWKNWRVNGGVAGGWDCELNSWCGHLSQGEERGWHFHGDEGFDSYGGASQMPVRTSLGVRETVEDSNDTNSKL